MRVTVEEEASQQRILAGLSAANEQACADWKEAHKNDPCERCKAITGVDCHPMGSLGKLTMICAPCYQRAGEITKAWWEGWEAGRLAARESFKRMSWWRRLLA